MIINYNYYEINALSYNLTYLNTFSNKLLVIIVTK